MLIACDAATPDATRRGRPGVSFAAAPRAAASSHWSARQCGRPLQGRRPNEAQSGIVEHRLGREAVEPGEQSLEASLVSKLDPVTKDQLGRIGEVPCRCGVMDRFGRIALVSVPRARPAMQRPSVLGLGKRELWRRSSPKSWW